MYVMIDNYDSFVFNLVRYMIELGENIQVFRNDRITVDKLFCEEIEGIILSPGPKTPKEAGITLDIIRAFKGRVPILGICLGHQSIGYAFGASIVKGEVPVHGKISEVKHDGMGIFKNIKNPLRVTRYHSLIVEKATIPGCLEVSCETKDGVIMGIRHKEYPIEGVQFHPEAELTESGHQMLGNFIRLCREFKGENNGNCFAIS